MPPFRRMHSPIPFVCFVLGAAAIGSVAATVTFAACEDAAYVTARPSLAAPASARMITTRLACYSLFTGDWANCAFTYRVWGLVQPITDLANNGGHVGHAGIRPFALNDSRNLEGSVLYAHDSDPGPLDVAGFTMQTPPFIDATVRHPAPMVSGRLAVDTTITAPWGGTFCVFDPAGRTLLTHVVIDVRVPNLEPLGAGNNHTVVRDGKEEHPYGTYGTNDSIATLLEIASEYRKQSNSALSVNDLSLPAGGLFDLGSNWNTPHESHREGKDADINRTNANGAYVGCRADAELLGAVRMVAAGRLLPRLICETRDRKHIYLP